MEVMGSPKGWLVTPVNPPLDDDDELRRTRFEAIRQLPSSRAVLKKTGSGTALGNLSPTASPRTKALLRTVRRKNASAAFYAIPQDQLLERIRILGYTQLTAEVSINSLVAHHLIPFRSFLSSIHADALDNLDLRNFNPDGQLTPDGSSNDVAAVAKPAALSPTAQDSLQYNFDRLAEWLYPKVVGWVQPVIAELIATRQDDELYPHITSVPTTINLVRRFVEVACHAEIGPRLVMEDQFVAVQHIGNLFGLPSLESSEDERRLHPSYQNGDAKKWKDSTQVYCGVFDGHSGREAACYAKHHMLSNIVSSPAFPSNVGQAIRDGFRATHKAFLERATSTGCEAGTTATVGIVLGNTLYVGNCGDSTAVLAQDGQAIVLTTNHTVKNESEVAEVIRRGGEIVTVCGRQRVDGLIQVTRSIGYLPAHTHLSSVPDVVRHTISDDDQFVVIASDGLWDAMSPEEVVEFVSTARAEVDAALILSEKARNVSIASTAPTHDNSSGSPRFLSHESSHHSPRLRGLPFDTPSQGSLGSMRRRMPTQPALEESIEDSEMDEVTLARRTTRSSWSNDAKTHRSVSSGMSSEMYLSYQVIAEALCSEAIQHSTAKDNITVSIIFFNHFQPRPATTSTTTARVKSVFNSSMRNSLLSIRPELFEGISPPSHSPKPPRSRVAVTFRESIAQPRSSHSSSVSHLSQTYMAHEEDHLSPKSVEEVKFSPSAPKGLRSSHRTPRIRSSSPITPKGTPKGTPLTLTIHPNLDPPPETSLTPAPPPGPRGDAVSPRTEELPGRVDTVPVMPNQPPKKTEGKAEKLEAKLEASGVTIEPVMLEESGAYSEPAGPSKPDSNPP